MKKHGNCFVCVYMKFVRIEPFSYFRNFLIHSICYRFWIKIFIKNISIVRIFNIDLRMMFALGRSLMYDK